MTDETASDGLTFVQCGKPKHVHDFFGPGSFERALLGGDGSERVCRCGVGALQDTMWEDWF